MCLGWPARIVRGGQSAHGKGQGVQPVTEDQPATAARADQVAEEPRPKWRARVVAAVSEAAANPASSRAKLSLLGYCFQYSRTVNLALAGNPSSRARLLRRVAQRSLRRGQWNVAVVAAEHSACPISLFRWLIWSSYPAVEVAVATNPRAAPVLMDRLTEGYPEARLRLYIAANPAAPGQVIDRLLGDPDPYVRRVAAAHPAATPESLRRLCGDMAQPAWTLRAAATNPACPSDLSDQLLTWLALGGAGASDPHFDPITCSGHPGSTEIHPAAWYANAARQDRAETHPLWRVRAAITTSRPRILISILRLLALDPRVEVRRTAARFRSLPYPVLRELRADTDAAVARSAETALKNKPKDPRRRLRLRWRTNPLRLGVALAIFLGVILVNTHALSTSVQIPSFTPGTVQLSDGTSLPGVIATKRQVAGGGQIDSGSVTGFSGLPNLPFVAVIAGTVPLTVTIPGAFTTGPSPVILSGPVQVDARQRMFVVLPDDPTSVTVTLVSPGQVPDTLFFDLNG